MFINDLILVEPMVLPEEKAFRGPKDKMGVLASPAHVELGNQF
jgi:hypothetical protein